MTTPLQTQLDDLARRVRALEEELARRDAPAEAAPAAEPAIWPPVVPAPAARPSAPRAPSPAPPAAPRQPWPPANVTPPRERAPRPAAPDLEALLGGRLFAWIGGAAVLIGVVFFVATAIHNGWIGEGLRVALAFIGSAALVAVGAWLHERKEQTQASLLMVAAGIAALYASLTAATALYDLIDAPVALFVAGIIGATATTLAVRFESPQIAGLGIVGALLAPVLTDAGTSGASLAFMAIALSSAVGVLLWQRWDWLAAIAYVVSLPQLWSWIHDQHGEHLGLTLAVLLGFWLLYLIAALGYELRVPTEKLRVSSGMLTLSNVIFTTGIGWYELDRHSSHASATSWVIAMAILHIGVGIASGLRMRATREVPLLMVAAGVGLSAIGLALALDGPALVAGWSVEAALLAWLCRRLGGLRLRVGSLAFLTLAGVVALDYGLEDGFGDVSELGSRLTGLVVVAIASLLTARLLPALEEQPWLRTVLDEVAAGFTILALAIALDGPALVFALAFGAVALAAAAARGAPQSAAIAAFGFVGVAIGHVLAYEARPDEALASGLDHVGWPLLAVVATAGSLAATCYLLRDFVRGLEEGDQILRALEIASAVAALYAASVFVLTLVPSGATGSSDTKQLALSAFWGVLGATLLFVGLARDLRPFRIAGIALLTLTIPKVFLYDLASLDSLARVGSFIGLGLLLLATAYGYQRSAATRAK